MVMVMYKYVYVFIYMKNMYIQIYRRIREEQDRTIAEKLAIQELEIQRKQKEYDVINENERILQKVKVLGYKSEKELYLESQRILIEDEKEVYIYVYIYMYIYICIYTYVYVCMFFVCMYVL
jgi:hypothetical protein